MRKQGYEGRVRFQRIEIGVLLHPVKIVVAELHGLLGSAVSWRFRYLAGRPDRALTHLARAVDAATVTNLGQSAVAATFVEDDKQTVIIKIDTPKGAVRFLINRYDGEYLTNHVTFELTPAEAALSGDWQLTMSNLGEGQVASLVSPTRKHAGAVRYTPQIPCDATWYIWARVLNQASNDAYQVTLDDMPDPPAIFEGDCSNAGNSYKWARLNWRDPMAEPCKYLQNPWAPMWTAGPHSVEFSYHESPALGRILLTTDPNLVPK